MGRPNRLPPPPLNTRARNRTAGENLGGLLVLLFYGGLGLLGAILAIRCFWLALKWVLFAPLFGG